MRMIFVNLPVKDVQASRRFFGALGFTFNEQFSSENTAAMVIEENIVAMLLEHARFRDFIKGDIGDPAKGVEVLTCLSAGSRAEVEETYAKAIGAGGKAWMPPQDHGFMYGVSFQDLDGHVWEVMWMDPAAVMPAEDKVAEHA
ncbi:MAG: putative lactoylglutathione lyase [Phenylobacterium sp.]|nr:putative lactoylglutathione lyase [Phenylobacterium sp.]